MFLSKKGICVKQGSEKSMLQENSATAESAVFTTKTFISQHILENDTRQKKYDLRFMP